jgi:hypothetical protein
MLEAAFGFTYCIVAITDAVEGLVGLVPTG